jgi:hypothetical protein
MRVIDEAGGLKYPLPPMKCLGKTGIFEENFDFLGQKNDIFQENFWDLLGFSKNV